MRSWFFLTLCSFTREGVDVQNPKFQMFTGADEQVYFRLRVRNGETILVSEGCVNGAGCEKGIASVKVNAPRDEQYERRTSVDRQFYFVLKAANGEIIGRSERYTTPQSRDAGIVIVKEVAPAAAVEDVRTPQIAGL